jgi:hypothetical protein
MAKSIGIGQTLNTTCFYTRIKTPNWQTKQHADEVKKNRHKILGLIESQIKFT